MYVFETIFLPVYCASLSAPSSESRRRPSSTSGASAAAVDTAGRTRTSRSVKDKNETFFSVIFVYVVEYDMIQ